MYFDTLDQGNTRGHISHIALLVSLKSVVIENGSGIFYNYSYTFMEDVFFWYALSNIIITYFIKL